MTDQTFAKNRRLILLLALAGLVVMFISTASYFASNPGLVAHTTTGSQATPASGQPQQAPAQAAPGMDEAAQQGVMLLMQKLQKNPTDIEALTGLTEHFMHTQDWQRAETFALRAVVAAPNETQPLYMLGIIQHNQNRHAEAAASLEKVVAAKDDPSVHYSLGILYAYYLDQPAKGLEHLRKALAAPEISPDLKKGVEDEIKAIQEHANHSAQQPQGQQAQ